MSEKFKKLKRKYLLGAILKSVVCGVSAGLLVVGAVLLALKLSAISLDTLYYVLMGVGCALVAGVIAFLIFMPTNKKVAARLDNEFGLEERVQTSLEYRGQEGTIIQLQREDTEEKLQTLPKAKFKFAGVWQFCIIAVIAIAIAFAGIFIPAKEVQAGGPVDPEELPAVVTEYHITSVRSLITNVESSELEREIKADTVVVLQELLDTLIAIFNKEEEYKGFSQGQLNNMVYRAIDSVELVINNSINYIKLATSMVTLGETKLSAAVMAGGDSYKTYEMKEYGHVETFYTQREAATVNRLKTNLDTLRATLNVTLENGLGELLISTATSTLSALDPTLLGVDRSDSLYNTLNSFVTELVKMGSGVTRGEYTEDEKVQNDLDNLFASVRSQLAPLLSNQAYSGAMRRFISNKLRIVFGLSGVEEADALESSGSGDNNEPKPGDDNPDDPPGGIGPGEGKYGSEDLIYDPFQQKYVKYYELLGKYKAILEELQKSGAINQEQYDMAIAYFEFMYGSVKADDVTE